jgi:MFS family permease
LGASPSGAGLYLALVYVGLVVGALSAGLVSNRLERRKLPHIVAGAIAIPVVWGMGRVNSIVGLGVLTGALWMLGGLSLALVNMMAGLSAGAHERGRVFGILGMAGGLAAILGGLGTGPAVDRWGFSTMLSGVALFCTLWPLAGLLLEEVTQTLQAQQTPSEPHPAPEEHTDLGHRAWLLIGAALVALTASIVGLFVRSLRMDGLGLPAAAISAAGAIAGAGRIAMVPWAGWLSDRFERKPFMLLSFLLGILGLIGMALASAAWQFWLASVLLVAMTALTNSLGPAWITDLVPREALSRGMTLFTSVGWAAGIVGFGGAGAAIQRLGMTQTAGLAVALVVLAALLVSLIRSAKRDARG